MHGVGVEIGRGPGARTLAAVAVFTAGTVALSTLVACGAAGLRACETDSDCKNNEICARDQCARTCSSDDECERTGTTCRAYYDSSRDEPINVCLEEDLDAGGDSGLGCTSDRDCRERFDTGPREQAFCSDFGRCVIGRTKHAVLLQDQTVPFGNAAEDGDGSEIAAAYLTDGAGNIVGFGQTLAYEPNMPGDPMGTGAVDAGGDTHDAGDTGGIDVGPGDAGGTDSGAADTAGGTTDVGGDEFEFASTIDGTRPDLDDSERCIAGGPSDTTPLGGSDGRLVVEFVDSTGEPILLDPNQRIVVIEWGTNCDADDAEGDHFRAVACKTSTVEVEPRKHCDRPLGDDLSGYNAFDVPDEI